MTRDEILDAATQIFSQKGFHAASMQDIAQAVNLQKASLYHHVNSKQELLVTILDRALDLLIEQMEEVLEKPLPTDEKLRQAIIAYLSGLGSHRDLAAVLLLEHRSLEPEFAARHVPRRDRFEHLWRELIHQGQREGIFNCPDAGLATKALMGVMNWSITWYRPEGALPIDEIASQLADLFLNGLRTR